MAALKQYNVKRLIGLSGVSHAGFILLAVVSVSAAPMAVAAVYFYLFSYLIASFAVFGVMTVLAGPEDTEQELGDYAGLAKQSPFLGGVLALRPGLARRHPPFAGFMAKLLVFVAAFKAGHYGLLAVAIAGVVISIYYYFGWIRAAYFRDQAPDLMKTAIAPGRRRARAPPSRFALAASHGGLDRPGSLPGTPGHLARRSAKGPEAGLGGTAFPRLQRQRPSRQTQRSPRRSQRPASQ